MRAPAGEQAPPTPPPVSSGRRGPATATAPQTPCGRRGPGAARQDSRYPGSGCPRPGGGGLGGNGRGGTLARWSQLYCGAFSSPAAASWPAPPAAAACCCCCWPPWAGFLRREKKQPMAPQTTAARPARGERLGAREGAPAQRLSLASPHRPARFRFPSVSRSDRDTSTTPSPPRPAPLQPSPGGAGPCLTGERRGGRGGGGGSSAPSGLRGAAGKCGFSVTAVASPRGCPRTRPAAAGSGLPRRPARPFRSGSEGTESAVSQDPSGGEGAAAGGNPSPA